MIGLFWNCCITWRYKNNMYINDHIRLSESAYILEKYNIISWNYIGFPFGYTKKWHKQSYIIRWANECVKYWNSNFPVHIFWELSRQQTSMNYIYKSVKVAILRSTSASNEIIDYCLRVSFIEEPSNIYWYRNSYLFWGVRAVRIWKYFTLGCSYTKM